MLNEQLCTYYISLLVARQYLTKVEQSSHKILKCFACSTDELYKTLKTPAKTWQTFR